MKKDIREVMEKASRGVVLDIRNGCVAVYFGSSRNCLSGIEDDPDCIFYAHGTFSGGSWSVKNKDIETAQLIAHTLNNFMPMLEALEILILEYRETRQLFEMLPDTFGMERAVEAIKQASEVEVSDV